MRADKSPIYKQTPGWYFNRCNLPWGNHVISPELKISKQSHTHTKHVNDPQNLLFNHKLKKSYIKTRDSRHEEMFLLIIPYWIERCFFWKKLSLERVINYLNKSWVGSRKCPPSDTYLPKILLSKDVLQFQNSNII